MKKLLLFISLYLLSACSITRAFPASESRRDSVQTSIRHDSIYIHDVDSVLVMQYLRGDTVYIDRDRVKIKYQTVYKDRIDTVTNIQTIHVRDPPKTHPTRASSLGALERYIPRWCWACVGLLLLIAFAFALRIARLFR